MVYIMGVKLILVMGHIKPDSMSSGPDQYNLSIITYK